MVGGGKRELRRQATDIWIKEATGRRSRKRKQDMKIFSLALSCCNFASWWYPPSAIVGFGGRSGDLRSRDREKLK
jgi:hypothetical protein